MIEPLENIASKEPGAPARVTPSSFVENARRPSRRALLFSTCYFSCLKLKDFRSYPETELNLDARPVVFTGDNGAGKTNLLEAVSLFAPGRGLRGDSYATFARKGSTGHWAVAATVCCGESQTRIGTGIQNTPGGGEVRTRQVRIEDETQSGPGVLGTVVRMSWLTPAMDRLFSEGASGRRKFLDRLVTGFDPLHGARIHAYEKAMRERNRLLADHVMETTWLGALEAQMAEHGAAMAAARLDLVARLRGAVCAAGEAFPKAEMALEGRMESLIAESAAVDAEDALREILANNRRKDQGAGRALEGPHRSDLRVRHSARNMEADQCSTGEQKALLIGIVLANARLLARHTGFSPVLLLDEIVAHLDAVRRAALFEEITRLGVQAWMTGTDHHLFENMGTQAQKFKISQGHVTSI